MVNIGNSWDELLKDEFKKEYYFLLRKFLKEEYSNHTVYPTMSNIFNALKYTAYEDVKCVILGQDPYFNEGQAHGLAFSVQKGVPLPPSLQNIYKELYDDLGIKTPFSHGCLQKWAEQGVLLLNTSLTVRSGSPMSHKDKGWEILTDKIIELLGERNDPVVFLLWGSPARSKKRLITKSGKTHFIIESVHPSPLSAYRGFFGGKYFSRTNAALYFMCKPPIDWIIE